MSDKEMDKLPQRSMGGVDKKTSVRTVVSGVVADLGPRLKGLVGKLRRKK